MLINVYDTGKIHNGTVTDIFESADCNQDEWPGTLIGVNINRFNANALQERIHGTKLIIEHVVYERTDNNPGNKIREEHNRLGDSLKEFTRQFAQHDRTANLQNSVDAKKCNIV